MIGKILALLSVMLAVSLFGNYILMQGNQELGSQVTKLTNEVNGLQSQIVQLERQMDTLDEGVNGLAPPRGGLQAPPGSKSITAVAVRPILLGDGFFQNVQYEGATMTIRVDVRDGEGLILVNTEIPTGVDFQASAKTAVSVAQKYTNVDLTEKDIIFSITAKNNEDLQAVDGASAGMAMTVLLVAEIQQIEISDSVLLTGTISEDGSMGKVGGIFEKAEAAAMDGAETFIVPDGLAVTHVQECEESREGPFLYRSCRMETKQLSPIMEEKYGMRVVEASDLDEVLGFFR